MTTTIDSTALFFGAPASLKVGLTEVGATLTPPKVMVEATQYAPEFQGAGGPISGAVFNTKIKAQVEFDVNEITATKLGWSAPGATSTSGSGTPVSPATAAVLTADSAVGDTLLIVDATTDFTVGDYIKIGTGVTAEFRIISGLATDGIEVTEGLFYVHLDTEDVIGVEDLDTTVLTWSTGRVPSTAFNDVTITGVGLDGRSLTVVVSDALSDGKLTLEMSDSAVAGSHIVMTGYYDGANPTLCPVSISIGAAPTA